MSKTLEVETKWTPFSSSFPWMKMYTLLQQISIQISLKFVPKNPINNIPALVQIMAWRCSSDKPLSEPVMVSLLMHICVIRRQWVNSYPCLLIQTWKFVHIQHGNILCDQRPSNEVWYCESVILSMECLVNAISDQLMVTKIVRLLYLLRTHTRHLIIIFIY